MKKRHLLLMPLVLFSFFGYSQVNVTVDIEEQRFLNGISSLERSKFFNIHTVTNGDSDLDPFMAEHNVGFGRRFFGPFNSANRTDGSPTTYPAYTPGTADNSVRNVRRFVATNHPRTVFRYNDDLTEAANWAAEYFLDVTNDQGRPEFWEPMNEPFVHADDFSDEEPDGKKVIIRMAEWFGEFAKKIKQTPELANMKVIGYSSAWPSMERFDFGHWQDRMKVFIDIAGPDVDAVSVHPYDGFNVTGQDSRRSGSNSEAILDLIETYTNQKFGAPKPLAITEFGIIEKGYPDTYSETESALSIRGINQMLFNFLEREDNMAIAIPFIAGKATFHYNQVRSKPYVPALFRPLNQATTAPYRPSNWVTSYKENFYKLWSDVKGDRNFITSDDFDVQVQSFVDGTKVHIIVNNLDDTNKMISLNMLSGTTGITTISIKSLKVYNSANPSYTVTNTTTLPSSLTLDEGETVVMTITYASAPTFTKSIVRKKYYGVSAATVPANRAPTLPLAANTANTFNFENVDLAGNLGGSAMLRLGVGIPLESSGLDRLPSAVMVNGEAVTIPTNWKGYDQANRSEFFGVIEIPVDRSLLKQGANTASITYAKTGGRISSVVLSVENRDTACTTMTLYADADADGLGDPNDSIESCIPVAGYVDNADDECPINANNNCTDSVVFIVKNIGESCPGANNGKIRIEADKVGDYAVSISGQSVTSSFTKDHELSSLGADTYTLNITNNSSRDTYEFKVVVLEAKKLAVKTAVSQSQKQVVLDLLGGKQYRINLNGIKFTTTEQKVTLSLMQGKNNISVHADADCQGEFKKTITLFDAPVAYPVPVKDVLNINLGNDTSKEITLTIYDVSGKVIDTKVSTIDSAHIAKLNTSNLHSGLYFVSLKTSNNSASTLKIVK